MRSLFFEILHIKRSPEKSFMQLDVFVVFDIKFEKLRIEKCVINFFSTFFQKKLQIICQLKKKLYLCTRFRERTPRRSSWSSR